MLYIQDLEFYLGHAMHVVIAYLKGLSANPVHVP